ncbi:MAG: polymer-forming cytoskeletal protein [Balneolaceae bacterium]|nr:MAG: polymer-forming cytoskeletal protein [Balneolaceae bacterium]
MFTQKNPAPLNGTANKMPNLNMISEGTSVKGTINSKSDIRIAGRIEGEIVCKGKVIISSPAEIEGNISSIEADVAGKVRGILKITGKVTLRNTAQMIGDIITKSLVVEEGAFINGSCRMSKQDIVENLPSKGFQRAELVNQNS